VIRTLCYIIIIAMFLLMGVCDMCTGKWRIGLAGVLLGVVNALIYWRSN